MPENATETAPVEQQVAKLGKVEKANFQMPKEVDTDDIEIKKVDNSTKENGEEKKEEIKDKAHKEEQEGKKSDIDVGKEEKKPVFDDAAMKEYLKAQGIEWEGGVEDLKQKLTANPTDALTEEQKNQAIKDKTKRRVDLFVAGGGTYEQYVNMERLASMDLKELSIESAKLELKQGGFNDEEIESMIKNRYYQFDENEIEQEEDETDKAFKKRTKEFGEKKLANKGTYIQNLAKGTLDNLDKAISSETLQAQQEAATSSKIDEHFKAMPRKLDIVIGDIGGGNIAAPVEYNISDTDIAEVHAMLKDRKALNNFIYTEDGSINIPNLTNVLLRNKALESASKLSFLTGQTAGIAAIQKQFGSSATEIGIGKVSTNQVAEKGKVASFGSSKRVNAR